MVRKAQTAGVKTTDLTALLMSLSMPRTRAEHERGNTIFVFSVKSLHK